MTKFVPVKLVTKVPFSHTTHSDSCVLSLLMFMYLPVYTFRIRVIIPQKFHTHTHTHTHTLPHAHTHTCTNTHTRIHTHTHTHVLREIASRFRLRVTPYLVSNDCIHHGEFISNSEQCPSSSCFLWRVLRLAPLRSVSFMSRVSTGVLFFAHSLDSFGRWRLGIEVDDLWPTTTIMPFIWFAVGMGRSLFELKGILLGSAETECTKQEEITESEQDDSFALSGSRFESASEGLTHDNLLW